MKKFLLLLLLGVLLAPIPVLAATQIVSESQARGESGSAPIIKIALNSGVPIKMPSGYKVFKGWLDNDTLAEIDSDRPFQQGASIIYLVARSAGSCKLSLVVRDSAGNEHLYVLKLLAGGRSSPDMVVLKGSSGILSANAVMKDKTPTDIIRAGLRRSGIIEGSELWSAVERFNALVDSGTSADSAAQQVGLELASIQKLIRLGQQSPIHNVSDPLPVPQVPQKPSDLVKALPPAPNSEEHKTEITTASKPQPEPDNNPEVNPETKPKTFNKKIRILHQKSNNLKIKQRVKPDPKLDNRQANLTPSQRALAELQAKGYRGGAQPEQVKKN